MIYFNIMFILIIFGPIACKSKKTTQPTAVQSVSAPFLGPEHLKDPGNAATLTPEKLRETINDESKFYQKDPSEESPGCFNEKYKALKYKIAGETILLAGIVNIKDCLTGDPNLTYEASEIKIYAKFTCTGSSIGTLNGVSYNNDLYEKTCEPATQMTAFWNLQITGHGKKSDGQIFTIDRKFMLMQADGSPCIKIKQNAGWSYSACSDVGFGSTDDSNAVSYTRLDYESLVAAGKNDLYYQSGKMNFVISGWKGVMTYSGATTPPNWNATQNGANAQTGDFGAVTPPMPFPTPTAMPLRLNASGSSGIQFIKPKLFGF